MKSYCLNVGDTYTLDYTLTAEHYAINDVEIVITPSASLSLVGVTSTSGTGILVGSTFSIPTIPANDVEVLTITVAIEDNVTENLTVEINATTTTVQSTTLDDTKIKDLDDIYIFQRRCLPNTNRYQVPNEAFEDIFNPQVDEVERWVNSNLIASQRAHAELYSIESENDLVITGSYDQNPDTTWDFGGTVDNKVSGFTINGTDYLTQFPYTDGSGNIVLDSAALEAYIEASLNLEGLGDKLTIAIDDSSDSSISVAFTITDPIEDLGDIDITIQGVSGSLLSTNPATYISTYTFTTEGSDVNNPDNIWSIVNDKIQLVFKRRNVEDTFYLDSSISDYRSALSQKGNPQRPFKNETDVLNRADFNAGDTLVYLKSDNVDVTTTKDMIVTAPISADLSKIFYVQDNHELTLKSDSDYGLFAWGLRADGDNVKINADLNRVDSSVFNIADGIDANVNIKINKLEITGTDFGNGVFYIGNGPTPPPTPHVGKSNINLDIRLANVSMLGSLTEREDTDFYCKVKKLTNSVAVQPGFGTLQLYRNNLRCNYIVDIESMFVDTYQLTSSQHLFATGTASSGDAWRPTDCNIQFNFGDLSLKNITSTGAIVATAAGSSFIGSTGGAGWIVNNSTITIKIDNLIESNINMLGLTAGSSFTNSTLILDVSGKSDGSLAIFEDCTFTNSKVIIRGDFETTAPAVVSFSGTSSPTLVIEDARLKCSDAPVVAPGDLEIYKSRLINTGAGTTVNRNAAGASNILAEGVVANGAADGNYTVLGSPFIVNAGVS